MFRNNTNRVAAIITLLSTSALPQTGYAASYLDTLHQSAPKTLYTTTLADITNAESYRATRTLDWKRPSLNLYFDLPPSERTSEIILNLSADPLTRVARNSPLEIQFNNGKPIKVQSNGRGFEARIPFDAVKSRSTRNTIRITYPTPKGADCVMPTHGAWSIDLSGSTLRIGGRANKRHMSLGEVSDYLSQPALSPKKVGLIARGPEGTDMQALAAQAISLRTPGIPNFSVIPRGNDFNVIMVTRDRLFEYTDDPMIINSDGPRIFVPRGRPTKLIFTADTDAEIVSMLQIFATRKLPSTQRPISSLGEINLQNLIGSDTIKIDKKSNLSDLAVSTNIAAGAQSYKFGVLDPASAKGEVRLRLTSTKKMTDKSRVSVALNGQILGAAKLDKKRKTVVFNVKPGTLNATENVLNIVPDLRPETGFTCAAADTFHPEFYVGDKSRITLEQSTPSPVTELSRMTSSGGLFAEAESYIALPKNTRDYQASLRILGRMAKSTGHGLVLADYSRGADVAIDKHLLIVGPSYMAKSHMTGAPKALREAMSGQSSTGENLLQANFENFASAGTNNSAVEYAAVQSGPRRISRGGVAALFGSGNGHLTGIISTTPDASFVQYSNNLIDLNHWNSLRGGVARWTSSSVVLAQTAQSDANITLPKSQKKSKFPKLGLSLPKISWPKFSMPSVSLPKFSLPSFRASKPPKSAFKPVKAANEATAKKVAEITPRLKPSFAPQSQASSGLRGTFQYAVDNSNSFEKVSKWTATKRWFKTKFGGGNKKANALESISDATDSLQDKVKPYGQSLKAAILNKLPAKGLVQIGDRTVSVYGLILIMAFALVLLLMSLAKPTSRLGGRH